MKKRSQKTELAERDFSAAYILVIVFLVAIIALLVVVLGPAKMQPTAEQPQLKESLTQSDLALELMAKDPSLSATDAQSMAGKVMFKAFVSGTNARKILSDKEASKKISYISALKQKDGQATAAGQATALVGDGESSGCPPKQFCTDGDVFQVQQTIDQTGKCRPSPLSDAQLLKHCDERNCNSDGTDCQPKTCPPKTSCQNGKLYQQVQTFTTAGVCAPTSATAAYTRDCPTGTACDKEGTKCVKVSSCEPVQFCVNRKLYLQQQKKNERGICVAISNTEATPQFLRDCPSGCNRQKNGCK